MRGMRFSVGFDLDQRVRDAIVGVEEAAWEQAIRADGSERERSHVCELTDRVDLSAWPEGSRLIARRTKLKDGDQQSFADHDGYRLAVFLADGTGSVSELDLDHRGHGRVEDRIRQGKDSGFANPARGSVGARQRTLLDQSTAPHRPCRRTSGGSRLRSNAVLCATNWTDRPSHDHERAPPEVAACYDHATRKLSLLPADDASSTYRRARVAGDHI